MTQKQKLYSLEEINSAIAKMADSINKEFKGDFSNCALVGIHRQGVPLAEALCKKLEVLTGHAPNLGKLDISMYRDDIGNRAHLPQIRETEIPFDVNDCSIILVDDVLSTGRTIRAALDALTDYGRAKLIRLAILVDRGAPEFPIRADYVGINLELSELQKVEVCFPEDGDGGIFAVNWDK